jgi:dTDP-4-dehydrorhamnose 3,5-epimerase
MAEIIESSKIVGVKFAILKAFADERGRFLETFRKEWFTERSWEKFQANRSDSRAGVLRGLHYHILQVDYWYCPSGRVRVALADLRPSSPTYMAVETVEIGDDNQMGIFIPVGVAHGFVALSEATLTYIVDNYYTGGDELGVAWDDPDLAIDWGVEAPILSGRDQANPRLSEIPVEKLPKYPPL